MGILIWVPDANRPGMSDTTGAFLPEAMAYARFRGVDPRECLVRFPADGTLDRRRGPCMASLRNVREPIDTLAVFCHGYKDGLQAGFTAKLGLDALATAIASKATIDAHVLLYACDTGRDEDASELDERLPGPGGDGGFADRLRDACEALGRYVTVMGHSTKGHATRNPNARRFAPGTEGQGGEWYIEPGSRLWSRWAAALREPRSTLRWRYPMMSTREIEQELSGNTPRV